MSHEVTGKLRCPVCKAFLGIFTSDGRGPFDYSLSPCHCTRAPKSVLRILLNNVPSPRPTGSGGMCEGYISCDELESLNPWHENAVRAMEDACANCV